MTGKAHRIRLTLRAFVLVAAVAAVAVPVAAAGNSFDPGIAARTLGSPDRQNSGRQAVFAPGVVASRLGSPDSRDTASAVLYAPSVVVRNLGSPDPAGTAYESTFDAGMIGSLGSPDTRDVGAQSPLASTDGGIDWGKVGIGIGVAFGAILLLGALGLGARQARHGRHRLGSA
jgi:hypothetical protein